MKIIGKDFLYNLKPEAIFIFSKRIMKVTDRKETFVKGYLGLYFPFDHVFVIAESNGQPTKDDLIYLPSNLQVDIISY